MAGEFVYEREMKGHFATDKEPLGRFIGRIEYELHEPLIYVPGLIVGTNRVGAIVVPEGTVTDFASIPRAFWRVLPPWDIHRRAAIVHDYLYTTQAWEKEVVDRIFLEAMEAIGVPAWKRQAMYRAVKWFGFVAWRNHRIENEKTNSSKPTDSELAVK